MLIYGGGAQKEIAAKFPHKPREIDCPGPQNLKVVVLKIC